VSVRGSIYMRWAKEHAAARYNLANSGLLGCTAADLGLTAGDLRGGDPGGLQGEPVGGLESESPDRLPGDLPAEPSTLPINGANADGYLPLLAAIAARYGVEPERVVLAQGTSGANFLAFATLVAPGDEVLVERPAYEPILAALGFLGARIRRFDRRFEQGWRPDLEEVRAGLAAGARLVVLTNPHNPSGVLLAPEEIGEIARLAAATGALVLVDEVYRDAWLEDAPPSHVHLGPHVLATSSLTKTYGLSGLRCGWVLAPAELADRMRRVNDLMGAVGPLPTEALAVAAFKRLDRLAARSRAILEPNLALVRAFLEEHEDLLDCVVPRRSMVVFPRLRREDDAGPLHDRLRRSNTSIVPGSFFEAPRHFRLGFAVATEDVRQGLAHLSWALRGADGS
jgi:aspartate/methionine/tyrosine aminotransferase